MLNHAEIIVGAPHGDRGRAVRNDLLNARKLAACTTNVNKDATTPLNPDGLGLHPNICRTHTPTSGLMCSQLALAGERAVFTDLRFLVDRQHQSLIGSVEPTIVRRSRD